MPIGVKGRFEYPADDSFTAVEMDKGQLSCERS